MFSWYFFQAALQLVWVAVQAGEDGCKCVRVRVCVCVCVCVCARVCVWRVHAHARAHVWVCETCVLCTFWRRLLRACQPLERGTWIPSSVAALAAAWAQNGCDCSR
jgi:hypothetical protein